MKARLLKGELLLQLKRSKREEKTRRERVRRRWKIRWRGTCAIVGVVVVVRVDVTPILLLTTMIGEAKEEKNRINFFATTSFYWIRHLLKIRSYKRRFWIRRFCQRRSWIRRSCKRRSWIRRFRLRRKMPEICLTTTTFCRQWALVVICLLRRRTYGRTGRKEPRCSAIFRRLHLRRPSRHLRQHCQRPRHHHRRRRPRRRLPFPRQRFFYLKVRARLNLREIIKINSEGKQKRLWVRKNMRKN